MKENYLFVYKKLRSDITNILKKLSNIDSYKYLKHLKLIDNLINDTTNEMDYLKAIYNLLYIYKEIIYLEYADILNYVLFDDYAYESKFNLIPIIRDNQEDKSSIVIKNDIVTKENNITRLSNELRDGYIKCLAYFLMISTMMAIPIGKTIKISELPQEKLYYTSKEIHTTAPSDFKIKDYNLLYLNLNDIPKYTSSYEPIQSDKEMVDITEYSPWIIEDIEAKRKVRETILPITLTGREFSKEYLASLIDTYGVDSYEYKYISDIMPNDRKYENKIYEVTLRIQDINNYILKDNKSKYIPVLITLLSELLLYLCMVYINNGPLIESIVKIINDIRNTKNIKENEIKELDNLLDKYLSILPYNSDEMVKKRIKNDYR